MPLTFLTLPFPHEWGIVTISETSLPSQSFAILTANVNLSLGLLPP